MVEKKVQNWKCQRDAGETIVGYCYQDNDYFCADCAHKHEGHKKVVLFELQEQLKKNQNVQKENVKEVEQLYDKELKDIVVLRGKTREDINASILKIQRLLDEIKESLNKYWAKVDGDFKDACDRVAEFPEKCKKHLEMIERIVTIPNITKSDVSQAEFKDFCLMWDKLIQGLGAITEQLAQEKQAIFQGFNNFKNNAVHILEPLTTIKEKIQIASLAANDNQLRPLVEEEYSKLDPGNSNALTIEAAAVLVTMTLTRCGVRASVTQTSLEQAFQESDSLGGGTLSRVLATDFVRAVLQSIN